MKNYILSAVAGLLLAAWLYCFFHIIGELIVPAKDPLPDGSDLFWFFSTIGALITSVSIVELGIKDPGTGTPKFGVALAPRSVTILPPQQVISLAMLIGWLGVASVSVYYGFFWKHSTTNENQLWTDGLHLVQNHAKASLGFVIAAIYAYLGIKP
jgi:hypothetical protein